VLVRSILTHTRKTFSRLFGHFFPKKKEVPTDLAELVKVFNAPEDLVLAFKWTAIKTGAKITMALAMSYLKEVI
jgi:hypothetical protein